MSETKPTAATAAKTTTAVAPAATQAVATQKPSAPAKGAMEVAQKGAARAEVEILTRLKDKDSADSLYNVILQLTGGDTLFVDKFAMCCKAQVEKHWKYDANTKKWTNPFLVIPVNSQLDALYRCASQKILPDGYNCNLIPYLGREEKRVDVSIDFKGLIDTAIKEKIIVDCDAKEVCANDDFDWDLGEVTRWHIDFKKPRGNIIGYCAWAILPNGRKKWHFMTNEEIDSVRSCAKTQMIWKQWAGEMSKKSVIRRLFKTLPNTPKLVGLMNLDNDAYDFEQGQEATPVQRRAHTAPVRQIVGNPVAALEAPAETAQDDAQDAVVEPELIPAQAVHADAPAQQAALF